MLCSGNARRKRKQKQETEGREAREASQSKPFRVSDFLQAGNNQFVMEPLIRTAQAIILAEGLYTKTAATEYWPLQRVRGPGRHDLIF